MKTQSKMLNTAAEALEDARAIEIRAMKELDDGYSALTSGAISRSTFSQLYQTWIEANMRTESLELELAHKHGKVLEQRGRGAPEGTSVS